MSYRVVIPARYASSRLPGKPLADIAGKPMIQHVYERAVASGARLVIVATDDDRVYRAAREFTDDVLMTGSQHQSGTDRVTEVVQHYGFDDDEIIVSLQGDEPLMPPPLIDQVAADLARFDDASVATLAVPVHDAAEIFDPNAVKVVCDQQGYALYFSRAVIPWHRDGFNREPRQLPAGDVYYRHLGIYSYRCGFLRRYVTWPQAPLEKIEALEQLRVLYHGERIHVSITPQAPEPGVDTPADLERVRQRLQQAS